MKIRNQDFDLENNVYIMGILNVTPDSFSDGGAFNCIDTALKHTEAMLEDGADIIDIGGESTRPGHQPLDEETEIARVIPVIEAINKRFDVPLSIDTYKARTGQLALEAGVNLINDVWGFKREQALASVTAAFNVPCCLMHNRNNENYTQLIPDVVNDLDASVQIALNAGVKRENILIDPGIGFAKSHDDNLLLMKNLDTLKRSLNLPILLGTSRKRLIGNTLNLPVDERSEGTAATTVIGVMQGCSIFRVHDVKINRRAARMALAIRRS